MIQRWWLSACVGCAVLSTPCAFADEGNLAKLQPVNSVQVIMPQRIMKGIWQNGRFTPMTPWIEIGDFAPAGPCDVDEIKVFDHLGEGIWYLGSGYHNPYWANDIRTLASARYNGAVASSLAHAWYWGASIERCIVMVFIVEQFDAECQDVHEQGEITEVMVMDYGSIPEGFYASPVCLRAFGGLRLPATPADDGAPGTTLLGGWVVMYLREFDPNTGRITPASNAQPLLSTVARGSASPIQWDDDSPTNLNHEPPQECENYTSDICSYRCELGGVITFWTSCIPTNGDVDGNGCVDDADLLRVLFDFGSLESVADINCDQRVDDADLLLVLFSFAAEC